MSRRERCHSFYGTILKINNFFGGPANNLKSFNFIFGITLKWPFKQMFDFNFSKINYFERHKIFSSERKA